MHVNAIQNSVVAVVGDVNPLYAVFLEGGQVIRREAVHAVGSRDVAETRAPEGKRVYDGFTEDDFFCALKALDIEN